MKKQQILERILRPISYDLNVMLRIPVIPNVNGNCAAPLALYSIAAMGFLGYLVASDMLCENESTERILTFARLYCDLDTDDANTSDRLARLFDSLTSILAPRQMGLVRSGVGHGLLDYSQYVVALNADMLAHVVLNGLKCLEADLIEDDELADRIWDRMMALSREEGDE